MWGGTAVGCQLSVLSLLALRSMAFRRLATKDGGTFVDVEIFYLSLKLYWCAALRQRKSGVSIYGLPWLAFLACYFFRRRLRVAFRRRFLDWRLRSEAGKGNTPLSEKRCERGRG